MNEQSPFRPRAQSLAEVPVAGTKDAAAYLALQEQTLRKWACTQTGPIQPIRVGNRLRWRWSDLRALVYGEKAE